MNDQYITSSEQKAFLVAFILIVLLSRNYRSHRDGGRSRSPRRQHSSRRSRSFSPRDDRHERRHHGDRRDRGGDRYRSRSRSPMSSRKRHMGSSRGGAGPISVSICTEIQF